MPITYMDADYTACIDTRRSMSGVLMMMASGVTFWQLKLQDVVALSTTEVEYMALAKGTQQACWVNNFLSEVGHLVPLHSLLHVITRGQ